MMKTDKEIDEFAKYIVKEASVEKPSEEFVNKVMDAIYLENTTALNTSFKPLISNTSWFVIVLIFASVIGYLLNIETKLPAMFKFIDVSFFKNISSIEIFSKIHFSNTFTLSFIIFSIFVIFQLIVIKNYFNKQHHF